MLKATRALRYAKPVTSSGIVWSETLNLPSTTFPPRPSPEHLAVYRDEATDGLYAWQKENRPATDERGNNNTFVLHDGPPYANGDVHVGHAVNKILKDLILRYNLSWGRQVSYRPGWDCHGLPIELKALMANRQIEAEGSTKQSALAGSEQKISGAIPKIDAKTIRDMARKLASDTVETQMKSFRSWGVMGEWDNPYLTMDRDYELRQLEVFKEMVHKGLIHRQNKPVHWSPSSQTALAEAELEYDDNHKVTAAYVKFPITKLPPVLAGNQKVDRDNVHLLIWTTTPWTLPANTAIGVRSDIVYVLVEIPGHGQMLCAKDRLDALQPHIGDALQTVIIDMISGKDLLEKSTEYHNVLSGKTSHVIHADFVTATSGTGLVHLAAGHGTDDYSVLQKAGFTDVFAPVDDQGKFTIEALPAQPGKLAGLYVESKGSKAVLEILQNPRASLQSEDAPTSALVLDAYSYTHRSPMDWRTKQPVITRATHQWFADVGSIQKETIASLEDIIFLPESGKTRLTNFLKGRTQWCISRQRAWGVPIPALYHKTTGEAVMTVESVEHIIGVLQDRGTDAWWTDSEDDPTWIPSMLDSTEYVRGKDTMDVWFDSGTSWTSLAKRQEGTSLADVYIEGSDQHRGWFQSSLLTHTAARSAEGLAALREASDKTSKHEQADQERSTTPLFEALITHGFTLDASGRKMSKSVGNVVTPEEILKGQLQVPSKKGNKSAAKPNASSNNASLGPDALRLWVAMSDYTKDITISQATISAAHQMLIKYRVTFKWLLGVLEDYPTLQLDPTFITKLTYADQVVLMRLSQVMQSYHEHTLVYDFSAAVTELNKFINADLSATYFETIKDRIYAGSFDDRLQAMAILTQIFTSLLDMLTPICPLLVQEVWHHIPAYKRVDTNIPPDEDGNPTLLPPPLASTFTPFDASILTMTPANLDFDPELFTFSTALIIRIRTALQQAQEEARRAGHLGSGLACNAELLVPHDAAQSIKLLLSQLEAQDELADLLVVSGVDILPAEQDAQDAIWDAWEREGGDLNEIARRAREWRRNVPWCYEREVEVLSAVQEEKGGAALASTASNTAVQGAEGQAVQDDPLKGVMLKVLVIPPKDRKCDRCWKYTVLNIPGITDAEREQAEKEDEEELLPGEAPTPFKELCERCNAVIIEKAEEARRLQAEMGEQAGEEAEEEQDEGNEEEDDDGDDDLLDEGFGSAAEKPSATSQTRAQKKALWRERYGMGTGKSRR